MFEIHTFFPTACLCFVTGTLFPRRLNHWISKDRNCQQLSSCFTEQILSRALSHNWLDIFHFSSHKLYLRQSPSLYYDSLDFFLLWDIMQFTSWKYLQLQLLPGRSWTSNHSSPWNEVVQESQSSSSISCWNQIPEAEKTNKQTNPHLNTFSSCWALKFSQDGFTNTTWKQAAKTSPAQALCPFTIHTKTKKDARQTLADLCIDLTAIKLFFAVVWVELSCRCGTWGHGWVGRGWGCTWRLRWSLAALMILWFCECRQRRLLTTTHAQGANITWASATEQKAVRRLREQQWSLQILPGDKGTWGIAEMGEKLLWTQSSE